MLTWKKSIERPATRASGSSASMSKKNSDTLWPANAALAPSYSLHAFV
jgi:hypothetical protein